MMLRAKLLLLWLLALAIPVQGFAAVLQACAPAMQSATAAAAAAPSHEHAHHAMPATLAVQHDEHAHHHDHQAAPAPLADSAVQGDSHGSTSHSSHHAKSSCSFCAACTVGAVLPLALSAPPAPWLPPRDYLALPASGFVGYLPENPDRPPALA